jgi:hypothetical protein
MFAQTFSPVPDLPHAAQQIATFGHSTVAGLLKILACFATVSGVLV